MPKKKRKSKSSKSLKKKVKRRIPIAFPAIVMNTTKRYNRQNNKKQIRDELND